MLTLRYVQKYTFRVTVERLLHHNSRTVGTPGVNLVSKCAGDIEGKKFMKEEREILSGIDAPLKKRQGGGAIMVPPPR